MPITNSGHAKQLVSTIYIGEAVRNALLLLIFFAAQNVYADDFQKQIVDHITKTKEFWAVNAQLIEDNWYAKIYYGKTNSSFGCVTRIKDIDNGEPPFRIYEKLAFSTMACELSGAKNFRVEATQQEKSPNAISIFEKVASKNLVCISAKGCDLASAIDVKNLLHIIVDRKGAYLEFSDNRAEILRVYLNDDLKITELYLDQM